MSRRITRVEVEGIDKSGKSTLVYYLRHLSGFRLAVSDRGVATSMALNGMHGVRLEAPDDVDESVIVYLTVDPEDWALRCSMTHEPMVPYDLFVRHWDEAIGELERRGAKVLRFDSSALTPYAIARKTVGLLDGQEETK